MSDPFKSPKPRDPKMEIIFEDVSAANDGIQEKESVESQAGLYSGRDGDALALNKDGYVHSDLIVGVQGQQIAHLSYFCPGLHGKDTKQTIARKRFTDLLSGENRFFIPIIQRRYCWHDKMIHSWFDDTRNGTRDHLGIHNTGNLVARWSDLDQGYILIDGQQRVTTTILFLVAIRDVMNTIIERHPGKNAEEEEISAKILNKISKMLYISGNSRLVPCFLDREAFYSILNKQSSQDTSSYQIGAYKILCSRIQDELRSKPSLMEQLEISREILSQCARLMGVTWVSIENPIDMSQVFLWLQEKSFGAGLMFDIPRPGETLVCADLVRNRVLSFLLNKPLQEQDDFYLKEWLIPLEQNFKSRDEFNASMKRYTETRRQALQVKSDFEKQMEILFKSCTGDTYLELSAYSRFITVFENMKPRYLLKI
ncbi:uncharacterized protein LOC111717842 isoform X2 [Eurytemora carolleeae]|uniref:uncharacterized protein LOC111717842 isoform X2 n=1 Tax=Eurytemora carolleeae TaxID=1294199 RepID=UPI000C76BEF1|nr:uncharacterized protein LOC111717842 isoform X2 [Eurytemora carolleeae]XP_023349068.1 uncharacterized protein LOC111717842 isoform X2 [Eurytemora carolleeae]|eukprot:XP_023349067.1 uncharacterized protein LOC111717842 isoform X2 [Eurytemora affinis]